MMVGRCISYWNSPFLGDMLVFWGVKTHDQLKGANAKCIFGTNSKDWPKYGKQIFKLTLSWIFFPPEVLTNIAPKKSYQPSQ